MIGKVKTGSYFKGVLDYNKKGEVVDKTIMADKSNKQIKEFHTIADQNNRTKNKVKHFILSFPKSDSGLDDFKLAQIGQDYLEMLGYKNNQYITYKHTDTKHTHIHIVANRIKMDDFKAVKDNNEKYKSRDAIMQLERKYNLTKTPRYSKNNLTKKNTQSYKAAEQRLNKTGQKTDKQIIKEAIKTELDKKPVSEQEFLYELKKTGITPYKNKAGNGYNFEFNGRTYKASSIHREYSFSKLNKQFEQNHKASAKEQRKQERDQKRIEQERAKQEQENERQRKEQERKQQEQERAKQEFYNAVKEQNHKKIAETGKKNPNGKLSDSQIKYILNHPDLDKSKKILSLASGGIEQPKQYFKEDKKQLDDKSIRDTIKERNKRKNKGNDLKR